MEEAVWQRSVGGARAGLEEAGRREEEMEEAVWQRSVCEEQVDRVAVLEGEIAEKMAALEGECQRLSASRDGDGDPQMAPIALRTSHQDLRTSHHHDPLRTSHQYDPLQTSNQQLRTSELGTRGPPGSGGGRTSGTHRAHEGFNISQLELTKTPDLSRPVSAMGSPARIGDFQGLASVDRAPISSVDRALISRARSDFQGSLSVERGGARSSASPGHGVDEGEATVGREKRERERQRLRVLEGIVEAAAREREVLGERVAKRMDESERARDRALDEIELHKERVVVVGSAKSVRGRLWGALARWMALWEEATRARRKMLAAVRVWTKGAAGRALAHWRASALQIARLRHLAARAVRRWAAAELARSFAAWRQHTR
ncbi:hypothetical protein T484DRAFT_1904584, partial [Baffinella frigidus]